MALRLPVLFNWVLFAAALVSTAGCTQSDTHQTPLQTLSLHSEYARMTITPQLGGRVLAYHLLGKPNLLKVGEAVQSRPYPEVNPQTGPINYFGHIAWLSPQSDWWQKQQLNLERKNRGATWPPDPYTVYADNRIIAHNPRRVALEGANSPISGTRLNKEFWVGSDLSKAFHLRAELENVTNQPLEWGLWFNTRVHVNSEVIVPVTSSADRRFLNFTQSSAPIPTALEAGVMTITPSASRTPIEGKYQIDPAAGWIAAHRGEQLFLIEFEPVAKAAIHPQQGQVEVYFAWDPQGAPKNVIELEVHGPYEKILPGKSIALKETWRILPIEPTATLGEKLALIESAMAKQAAPKVFK